MIKHKPILFSTEMVKAILDGRKTQTRRVIKSKHESGLFQVEKNYDGIVTGITSLDWDECPTGSINPLVNIGDVLWVRETWQYTDASLSDQPVYVYRASDTDWETLESWKWKPSIHMPKEAARIFLKVTNVRVERLHDTSENDAISEGVELMDTNLYKDYCDKRNSFGHARISFASLWESINGRDSWEENPYVFVYDFKQIDKPSNFLK